MISDRTLSKAPLAGRAAGSAEAPRGGARILGSERRRWAVIGGGMLGMTLALRLARAGRAVTLIESATGLGGLASPWKVGDIEWDRHYHVTLLSDSYTRGVLADLDLEAELKWVQTRTGFFAGGNMYPLSTSFDYLRLPSLGLVDKARLAANILYGSRIEDWRHLENELVEDWLVRISGRSTFDRLWLPLLRAKLGESYRETSAAFIWATIRRLYAARRSGLKREMFGYVPGGYRRIVERFERELVRAGVVVKTGSPVRKISRSGSTLTVVSDAGREEFDRTLLTVSPRAGADMIDGLPANDRDAMNSVRYQGIVCASLVLDRPLADYYLTYITDPGFPFTAVVEMSSFVDRETFGGKALIYLPRYVDAGDAFFGLDADDIRERFIAGLEKMYPRFRREHVQAFRISRVREVFPIPTLGYSRKLPAPSTAIPGLFAVSSAHIVNGTLNVNDTVALAERAASELIESDDNRITLAADAPA